MCASFCIYVDVVRGYQRRVRCVGSFFGLSMDCGASITGMSGALAACSFLYFMYCSGTFGVSPCVG